MKDDGSMQQECAGNENKIIELSKDISIELPKETDECTVPE